MPDMIHEYYHGEFARDLAIFMPRPDVPYFGHTWELNCGQLNTVPRDRRAEFVVCLYFTVLIDQGMHAHFRPHYKRFETLTRYPKFCHGLGQFQKNPRAILDVPVERGFVTYDQIDEVLAAGIQLFIDEVIDFSERHMPALNPRSFFEKIIYDPDVQIPLLVVMVDPTVKKMPAWRAYEGLREAVFKRWPREQQE